MVFPTKGPDWELSPALLATWRDLYPDVNVELEAKHALGWVLANPQKRKTARGMPKFLTSWFLRSLERRQSERREWPRVAGDRRLGTSSRYQVPCPHEPRCANTYSCCRKQDTEVSA